jgi:putative proteasome-type protease
MSFCLGIKVESGLIGIADTRLTSGTARVTARKVTIHQHGHHSIFLMTSGLRSVRDKALTYFNQVLNYETENVSRTYQLVNLLAEQIRRVAKEDKESLLEGGLDFNLHALVGGQLDEDDEHRLYMIYPQGNWVEVGTATPYYIIGESGPGRPILERTLKFDSSLEHALRVGFLSYNATHECCVDVDYPLDVVAYRKDTFQIVEHRYERKQLQPIAEEWEKHLKQAAQNLSADWTRDILQRLP